MSKRGKLVVAAIAILAAAALGFFIWRGRTSGVAEVYPVSNLNVFGDDFATMSGSIEAGKVQEVRLANSIVNEMKVKEGDKVNMGDVLMVYDTESYQITLLTDEAKIAVLEAQIHAAQREITRLSRLRPSEQGGGGGGGTKTIDHGELKLEDRITSDKQGLNGKENGSECDLVFLCTPDALVSAEYLKSLRSSKKTAEFKLYKQERIEDVDTQVCYGSWIVKGKSLPKKVTSYEPVDPVIANVTVSVQPDEGVEWPDGVTLSAQLLADGTALGDPKVFEADTEKQTVTFENLPVKGQDGKTVDYTVDVTPVDPNAEDGDAGEADESGADEGDGTDDGGSADDGATDDGGADDGGSDDGSADDGGADDGSADDDGSTDDGDANEDAEDKPVLSDDVDTLYVNVETLEVIDTNLDEEGEKLDTIVLTYGKEYPDTLYRKVTKEALTEDWEVGENVKFGDEGAFLSKPQKRRYGYLQPHVEQYVRFEIVDIEGNVGDGEDFIYTRADIAQMIAEKQREMRTADIELRKARLTYQKDQITAQTGEVKSAVSGTVTKVVPYDQAEVDSVIIEVRGDRAYTLVTYVDELSLDSIHEGDELEVTAYESGASSKAKVTDVLDTPSPEGGYMGFGDVNPNNSWYAVRAEILNKDADFVVGEYCDVSRVGQEQNVGGVYLPAMFVRKDERGHYVLVAGEDGRLERRQVTTGTTLWGSYLQILSGITIDDNVAFPYGKTAVEGMQTEQADYPEY